MGPPDTSNRRRHERVAAPHLEARIRRAHAGPFESCAVRDLSIGGLFITSKQTPPIGCKLLIVLKLPGFLDLYLPGDVVRHAALPAGDPSSAGIGIELRHLPTEVTSRLASYIEDLKQDNAPS